MKNHSHTMPTSNPRRHQLATHSPLLRITGMLGLVLCLKNIFLNSLPTFKHLETSPLKSFFSFFLEDQVTFGPILQSGNRPRTLVSHKPQDSVSILSCPWQLDPFTLPHLVSGDVRVCNPCPKGIEIFSQQCFVLF